MALRKLGLCFAVSACVALPAFGAEGDGAVELRPGKWEFQSTTRFSLVPEPRVETRVRCVTEQTQDPVENLTQGGNCRVTDRSTSGNTVRWAAECGVPGAPGGETAPSTAKATGQVTSEGDRVHGQMDMSMAVGEQEVQMDIAWTGQRLGDCD